MPEDLKALLNDLDEEEKYKLYYFIKGYCKSDID